MLLKMKQENLFTKYLESPGAKPMWLVAYESGAGSVDFLRQVARGERKANPSLARGIEVSTGGLVTCKMLRPDDFDCVWGECAQVRERMEKARRDPAAVRSDFLKKRA